MNLFLSEYTFTLEFCWVIFEKFEFKKVKLEWYGYGNGNGTKSKEPNYLNIDEFDEKEYIKSNWDIAQRI